MVLRAERVAPRRRTRSSQPFPRYLPERGLPDGREIFAKGTQTYKRLRWLENLRCVIRRAPGANGHGRCICEHQMQADVELIAARFQGDRLRYLVGRQACAMGIDPDETARAATTR